jgi:hypothetical protein
MVFVDAARVVLHGTRFNITSAIDVIQVRSPFLDHQQYDYLCSSILRGQLGSSILTYINSEMGFDCALSIFFGNGSFFSINDFMAPNAHDVGIG